MRRNVSRDLVDRPQAQTGTAPQEPLNPYTWLAWLSIAVLPALLTRHPVYLAASCLAVWATFRQVSKADSHQTGWRSSVRLGLWIWAFTIPFNMLTVHAGDIVLLRLPSRWPIIGGSITLEAAAYGATTGLALTVLLMAFATFNMAVDTARLLRMVPGAFYQAGVVTAIAVTFVPHMVRAAQEIKEAQEIRGHRFRGLRDLLPLFMPLLTMSLERAIQLAESMESRGFGGMRKDQRTSPFQILTLALMIALAAGLFVRSYWTRYRFEGAALIAMAIGGLVGIFWAMGRQVPRTRYRRWLWTLADSMVSGLCLAAGAGLLATWILYRRALIYYPYPPYSIIPHTEIWLIAIMLAPLSAAAVLWRKKRLPEASAPIARRAGLSPRMPEVAHDSP